MRRKVIAGNWKMNMTPSQAVKLVTELRPNVNNPDVDVVFCVPSIDIVPVVEAVNRCQLWSDPRRDDRLGIVRP